MSSRSPITDPASAETTPADGASCVFDVIGSTPSDPVEWNERTSVLRQRLQAAGVTTVYLVNGTFGGDDPNGLWASLDRLAPRFTQRRRQATIRLVDAIAGEAGNFTSGYANSMQRGLQENLGRGLQVERLYWSGENHHLGRATGAMQLLDHLMDRDWKDGQRVLFLAQSHGGNVLALVSSLLSGDTAWRQKFLTAADVFARSGDPDAAHPVWRRVRDRLEAGDLPFRGKQLDFVTLGTPITYPFESAGHGNVLHLINHHPRSDRPRDRTAVPRSLSDVTRGADGDYVHQIGMNGSNFAPLLLCWRQVLANRRLRDLLGGQRAWRSYFARLRAGVRVRNDGNTRLIDYGPATSRRIHHVLGHGVYCHRRFWVPQLEQIVAAMYESN